MKQPGVLLPIDLTNITNTDLKYHVLQVITKGGSERVGRVGGGWSIVETKNKLKHRTNSRPQAKGLNVKTGDKPFL